jgi:hypothetical protein
MTLWWTYRPGDAIVSRSAFRVIHIRRAVLNLAVAVCVPVLDQPPELVNIELVSTLLKLYSLGGD